MRAWLGSSLVAFLANDLSAYGPSGARTSQSPGGGDDSDVAVAAKMVAADDPNTIDGCLGTL